MWSTTQLTLHAHNLPFKACPTAVSPASVVAAHPLTQAFTRLPSKTVKATGSTISGKKFLQSGKKNGRTEKTLCAAIILHGTQLSLAAMHYEPSKSKLE